MALDFDMLINAVTVIGTVIAGFIVGYYLTRRTLKEVERGIVGAVSTTGQVLTQISEPDIMKKASSFLITPKLFLYLDKEMVDSLFFQISPSEKTTGIERETVGETEKGVGSDFPIMKGKFTKKRTEKEKAQIEILQTSETKHDAVLKHLISGSALKLGIEDFTYNPKAEKESLENWEDQNVIGLSPESKEDYLKIEFGKQLEKKIQEIEDAKSELVLMKIDCDVGKDKNTEGIFLLEFPHPINIAKKYSGRVSSNDVLIQIRLSPKHMTEIGFDVFSTTKRPNVKVLGRLLEFDRDSGLAIVRPISVY